MKESQLTLESWTENLVSKGRNGFSIAEVRNNFSDQTDTAIKFALLRLSAKNKIISIFKGYYLIITPQYASRGILPPSTYLDAFMGFLERPYYLGLLNAAGYYGASHQQPQEFFV